MPAPTVALVAVASPVESGGERGERIIASARTALEAEGVRVVGPSGVVWNVADALRAADHSKEADLLLLIHCSWVVDSLQFQLVEAARTPVLLWAVPYPETFSLASVKHFASVASRSGIVFRWGYGDPGSLELARRARELATVASVARRFASCRAALMTPRATWRMAGPQDMSYDEWDLAQSLGITLLHLGIDELIAASERQDEAEAVRELERHAAAFGEMDADRGRLIGSAKVYLAVRRILADYGLDALAVACYPTHFGLVNLAASWLSDEGAYLDPEGDVGHAVLANALLALAPMPVALAEPVLLDADSDRLFLRHEGSAPASLAAAPSEVHVVPLSDATGTLVEFPLRPIDSMTAASLCGRDGDYTLWAAELRSCGISPEEWGQRGRGFLAALSPHRGSAAALLDRAFATGMDHHLLLQAGERVRQLADLAEVWGMRFVRLDEAGRDDESGRATSAVRPEPSLIAMR